MKTGLTPHPYANRVAVLTTKHDKGRLIAPPMAETLSLHINELRLDTDVLGTFSGEVERKHSPINTAILKAKMGMESTGLALGFASEGSIGPDPVVPFLHSDIEILLFLDLERDIVVKEIFRSFDIKVASTIAGPDDDITEWLHRADFPQHSLIVRPSQSSEKQVEKGIQSLATLREAIAKLCPISSDQKVVIESDLRAHHSPSRQENIRKAAQNLALRISHLCPVCDTPGWGRSGFEKGLICDLCREIIPDAIHREILGCAKCDHSELGEVIASRGDPAQCPLCNP